MKDRKKNASAKLSWTQNKKRGTLKTVNTYRLVCQTEKEGCSSLRSPVLTIKSLSIQNAGHTTKSSLFRIIEGEEEEHWKKKIMGKETVSLVRDSACRGRQEVLSSN